MGAVRQWRSDKSVYSFDSYFGPGVTAKMFACAFAAAVSLSVQSGQSAQAGDAHMTRVLANASMTLPEAMEVALGLHEGYVVEAELEEKHGMYFYQIELVSEQGEAEVFVNPSNGVVIGMDQETGLAVRLRGRWEARLEAMRDASLTLVEAIRLVHKEVGGGVVVDADLRKRHFGHTYQIRIRDGETEHEVEVALSDGSVVDHDIDD